jgi:hypothetical protein
MLDEESTGVWLDTRTSYDFLFKAAKEFVRRTKFQTAVQRFETSEDVEAYTLNANFMGLFLTDKSNRFYVKYNNSAADYFLRFKDYEDIRVNAYTKTYDLKQGSLAYLTNKFQDDGQDFTDWDATSSSDCSYMLQVYQSNGTKRWAYIGICPDTTNSTDRVAVHQDSGLKTVGWNGDSAATADFYEVQNISTSSLPDKFTIKDKASLYSQITGTATAAGAATAGECQLTDSAAAFLSTDYVSPGDHIHNTTDGSTGVVLEVLGEGTLKTALFSGTNNAWASSDAYVIQPMGRAEVLLDPPPSTSNHLVTVEYIKMPDPVYSDYRMYNFPFEAMEAIVAYAAWLYKYRDSEPNMGDALYKVWDLGVTRFDHGYRPVIKRRGLRVNFKKRR